MTAEPVERQVGVAEAALRTAGMALGQWYRHSDNSSLTRSARREAAGHALSEMDAAVRALAAAREALAEEIRAGTAVGQA